MRGKKLGMVFVMLSAFIFGFTPILVRVAYDGGANGITMTFLRGLWSLPILACLSVKRKKGLRLVPGEGRQILILGLASSSTTLLLYASYSYVPVGMATALHFVYPLLVNLICRVVFREKLGRMKNIALVVGTVGVAMFSDLHSSVGAAGVILALFSGAAYAFYIVYLAYSGLKRMDYFRLAFYLSLISATVSGLFGWRTGQLRLSLTPEAWLISMAVSWLTAIGATVLFQQGVCRAGSSNAALVSTFEPVTSVVLGTLLLHENMTPAKWLGCGLILSGVALLTLAETRPRCTSDGTR